MSRTAADAPHFLIITGPNGSGESSAYQASIAEVDGRSFRIINPDLFAARIHASGKLEAQEANLEAVRRIEAWLETSLLAGHTVGVETVLSTSKYRRLVTLARELGYRFQLIYVILDDPLRNVEHVTIRTRRGGHSVPKDKIIKRYWRSLEELPWFLAQADDAWLWDNSGATLRALGNKQSGVLTLDERAMKPICDAATAASKIMA